jgi:MarR family transcriptional regulator, transcriptional regulator for hemolysin
VGGAGELLLRQPGVVTHQMLVDLEADGLIERRDAPRDKRRRLVHLTPRGAEVLTEAHRRAIALEERMMSGLSEAEQCKFGAWLVPASVALSQEPTA